MIIKKFVGKTEEEAVEAARKELGSGAVIMNVKLVKRKGLGALFGGKRTEVTAALEEESDTMNKARSTAGFQTQAGTEGQSPAQTAPRNQESVLAGNNRLSTQESQAIEKKLDSLQELLVNRFQQSEEERKDALDKGDMGVVEEEREEEGQEITEQQRFIRLLYNTMLRSEVDEKYGGAAQYASGSDSGKRVSENDSEIRQGRGNHTCGRCAEDCVFYGAYRSGEDYHHSQNRQQHQRG